MAIDTITPVADSILLTGDSVSFIVDDTYTTLTIEVETASGYEYAYDGALGGAQSGYTVSVVASGGRHTFTVTRSSGWNISPFNFRVVENETGSSATTTIAYSLTSENTFPQGDNPYNGSSVGTLRLTDTSVLVAGDVGELDFVGFTIASLGNGLVRITDTGGGGGTWGSITGTLADQTDLQAALDAKVTGPASVTDNHLVRFDGTTGKLVQDSSIWLGNNGSLVAATGASDSRLTLYGRASAPAGAAGFGDIWVANSSPTSLRFTDSASSDHEVVLGSGITAQDAVYLTERSDHVNTPAAGYAELWIKSATQQDLVLTTDTGEDREVVTVNSADEVLYRLCTMDTTGKAHINTYPNLTTNSGNDLVLGVTGAGLICAEGTSALKPPVTAGKGAFWTRTHTPCFGAYSDDTGEEFRLSPETKQTGAPGTGDDLASGYPVGTIWVDETNDDAYISLDSTTSTAVWKKITP